MSALRLTVRWLAAAVAGRIVSGDPEQEIGNIVPPQDAFIFVDEGQGDVAQLVAPCRCIPFLEEDGSYSGVPADDEVAIREATGRMLRSVGYRVRAFESADQALEHLLAPDAVLGYHTALEAHGYGQSVYERLFFLTQHKVKAATFRGRVFVILALVTFAVACIRIIRINTLVMKKRWLTPWLRPWAASPSWRPPLQPP